MTLRSRLIAAIVLAVAVLGIAAAALGDGGVWPFGGDDDGAGQTAGEGPDATADRGDDAAPGADDSASSGSGDSGSSGSSGGGGTATEPALPRDPVPRGYASRANAICRRATSTAERLREDTLGEGAEAERRYLRRLASLYGTTLRTLGALDPPRGREPDIQRLLAEGRRGVARVRESRSLTEALAGGEPFAHFNARAVSLGLDACAR